MTHDAGSTASQVKDAARGRAPCRGGWGGGEGGSSEMGLAASGEMLGERDAVDGTHRRFVSSGSSLRGCGAFNSASYDSRGLSSSLSLGSHPARN